MFWALPTPLPQHWRLKPCPPTAAAGLQSPHDPHHRLRKRQGNVSTRTSQSQPLIHTSAQGRISKTIAWQAPTPLGTATGWNHQLEESNPDSTAAALRRLTALLALVHLRRGKAEGAAFSGTSAWCAGALVAPEATQPN